MADITISDLELAPALADDMVLPVENTTDTYAATLAMLRRLINKTFVEVENADLNTLTDDGFYQCTGTPTNSPVAGAINWTLQVSAESGVIVQRTFSLDDNFANLYIRRWNGVTWTGWLEVGAGALANKADIDASNFNADGKSLLSGLGMPSGRYIDLTFGSSGSTYTAPANGWFFASGNWAPNGSLFNVTMDVGAYGVQVPTGIGGPAFFRVLCPVVKGAVMTMSYTLATIVNFRFIYAQGNGSLYYYVGDTVQDASLINAGAVLGQLANVNAASRGYLVDSYHNGTEWYRIYSDGWIEQGGRFYNNADVENTISFLKPFKNTDYSLLINHGVSGKYEIGLSGKHSDEAWGYTTTNFQAQTYNAVGLNWIVWSACGY